MKIRNGFVSNSSSSSFIVVGKAPNCNCYKLSEQQIQHLSKRYPIDPNAEAVYITEFFSDGNESRYEGSEDWIYYIDGNHGHPYGKYLGGFLYDGYVTARLPLDLDNAFYDGTPCCDAVWIPDYDFFCETLEKEV